MDDLTFKHTNILPETNTEMLNLKAIYDAHAHKLLGFLSLVVSDEKIKLEILEKTFVRIYQDSENYDPTHFNLFFGMIKVAVTISAECMNVPTDQMERKFLESIKSKRFNIK